MKITTLIPNHNNAQFLARILDTVLGQSHPPAEVVVLDDCSTDNSLAILTAYQAKFPSLKVVRYPNKSENWLRSLYQNLPSLTGDYLHNISADDFVLPGFYKTALAMAEKHPETLCIFADSYLVSPSGVIVGQSRSGIKNDFLIGDRLREHFSRPGIYPGGAACLIKASGYAFLAEREAWKMGPYNDSIGYSVLAAQKGAIFLEKPFGAVFRQAFDEGHGGRVRSDPVQLKECLNAVDSFLSDPAVVGTVDPLVLKYLRQKVHESLD